MTVQYDRDLFARFRDLLQRGIAGGGVPAFEEMFNQWAGFYGAFVRKRFATLSRSGGGGEWPPLALSTIMGRRPFAKGASTKKISTARASLRATARAFATGGKWDEASDAQFAMHTGKRSAASILWDTGQLVGALNIGAAGNITRREGPSIAFGIGGGDEHAAKTQQEQPARQHGRRSAVRHMVTMGQLASYHQHGGGHLPKREILVTPPQGDPIYGRFKRAAVDAVKAAFAEAKTQ